MYLIYDTETTGLPNKYDAPISDSENWPRMVQIAWQLHDKEGKLLENDSLIIKPKGYDIPFNASKIHGITTEKAIAEGIPLVEALEKFQEVLNKSQRVIGHNIEFDQNIVGAEFFRKEFDVTILDKKLSDTMKESVQFCAIPGGRGGNFKFPRLNELHEKLFGEKFEEAHNASADVNATARCFMELLRKGVITQKKSGLNTDEYLRFKEINTKTFQPFNIKIEKQVQAFNEKLASIEITSDTVLKTEIASPYFHFHNHSSFSLLTATSSVENLVDKAIQEKMPAVGMTDSGNLMGAFKFLSHVKRTNKDREKPIMPIVGCEFYISENYEQTKFTKDNPDRRYPQLILAKNHKGFKNLSKLSSIGFVKGYYSGFARIGKELIQQYKENLITTTGPINSEIPHLILNVGEIQAEEAFLWWKNLFGDDFYVELIRHGLEEEEHVNKVLIEFARKHEVKILAQNNTFYIAQKDSEAHDILLCVRDGEKKATEIGRGRDKRFGFPNNEFYFKSQDQMKALFQDIPEAIENLSEFLDKFETYDLATEVLLPKFNIPKEFIDPQDELDNGIKGENAYLKHLTFEGAKRRYGEITTDIKERLDFELQTIANTGYPGYFLIVQDFTTQAREMGVSVGPGRGSAAGSAVAYCVGITNVDPIKYDLLFERFLNPDRVSLPDIDIDFDDRGRDDIIRWVVNKYGHSQVAQIITYGTMAGKSAIRDTGRVLDLPLPDTDRIAKKTHIKLNQLFSLDEKKIKAKLSPEEFADAMELKAMSNQNTLEATVIKQATVIEGSLRNTGIHACGIIITPKDITELVPVAVTKDVDLLVTQFDNSVVEDAGLLKMDFLGLRTLTIIKDAITLIKANHNIEIDVDEIPLDDEKTYEIFRKGQTVAIFQYESIGMQKSLKELQPDKFGDLIAMNALYRPGPIQYIPKFIARKNGVEPIDYDLPDTEEILKDTYGITVYQEQVMLLSQKLANFTKGEADVLRKAMGKKIMSILATMKPQFIKGGTENGHPEEILAKIWKDWEAFAEYAFNKSHSTCYALIAYHTAYLKANYPAEFMAAVLSNNMNNIKQVTFFMEECKRMGIPVLGPNVNESIHAFSVNKEGAIRFGMAAVKGVGSAAVDEVVRERDENGKYESIFDFVKRIDLRVATKKTIENLALAGGYDDFEIHRAQFFYEEEGTTNLDKLIKYGANHQAMKESAQTSLFGEASGQMDDITPNLPDCSPWNGIQKLTREKEVVGIYISSHPLDDFKYEVKLAQNISINQLKDNEEKFIGRELAIVGIISNIQHRIAKNGNEYGSFTIGDYTDQYDLTLFGEDYLKFRHFLQENMFLALRLNVSQRIFRDKDGKATGSRIYVNVTKMQLLRDVLESQVNKITFNLKLKDLNDVLLNGLLNVLENHQGDKPIYFNLLNEEEDAHLSMPARKRKVHISRELLSDLEELEAIGISFN